MRALGEEHAKPVTNTRAELTAEHVHPSMIRANKRSATYQSYFLCQLNLSIGRLSFPAFRRVKHGPNKHFSMSRPRTPKQVHGRSTFLPSLLVTSTGGDGL